MDVNLKFRRQHFSLIELLVVSAILSTLMMLLTPSLRRAYDSAQTLQCLKAESTLGVQVHYFTEDSNDQLPLVYLHAKDNHHRGWSQAYSSKNNLNTFWDYYRELNRSSFCEAHPRVEEYHANFLKNQDHLATSTYRLSLTYFNEATPKGKGVKFTSRTMGLIRQPSRLIAAIEETGSPLKGIRRQYFYSINSSGKEMVYGSWHVDRSSTNALFFDGHAETIFAPKSPEKWSGYQAFWENGKKAYFCKAYDFSEDNWRN